jgi:hypothetical protein
MTQKYPIIRVRATSKQVEEFYKRGGPRYLRNLLDAPEQDHSEELSIAYMMGVHQGKDIAKKEQNEPK